MHVKVTVSECKFKLIAVLAILGRIYHIWYA